MPSALNGLTSSHDIRYPSLANEIHEHLLTMANIGVRIFDLFMDAHMPLAEDVLERGDLLVLLRLGKQLASEVDLANLLETILVNAGRLTDSPEGSVLLYDEKRVGLYFAAATGPDASMLLREIGESSAKRVPLQSKAGIVFSSGHSIIVNSLESDPEHYKGIDRQTEKKTESMVCVPLAVADQVSGGQISLGAIQILNKRSGRYTDRDRILLEYLADQAAVAIHNATLFKSLLSQMGLHSSQDAKDLVRELNAEAHAEVLTLLFADMRGFTQLCQVLHDPKRVQVLISTFMTLLTETILDFGGVVNKCMGDGMLAFFRQTSGPLQAVESAFAIIEKFEQLRGQWDRDHNQDLRFLDIGIGIVTGEVILGTVGSGKVRDFTAIGEAVNLAAAFEKKARGGMRILIDQKTLAALGDSANAKELEYKLGKPDQDVKIKYKMYHLIGLDSSATPETKASGVPLKIFLCHSTIDTALVRQLWRRLVRDGLKPWLDDEDLLPGQDSQTETMRALRESQAVIACLSSNSVKKSGFLNLELKHALDIADSEPEGSIFIIPVKLDDCELPDRLSRFFWVNCFEDAGYDKLLRALKFRAESLQKRPDYLKS